MRRVAWRSVRAHAKQFFLTTFAVMLGVAFLSGTLALRASMSETFSKLTSSTITSDLYVQGPKIASDNDGSSSSDSTQSQPIDGSLADQIKRIDGVEAAKPEAQMNGVLVGANDTPVANMGAPTLFLPLYDKEPGLTWAQGHRPQGEGEIALLENVRFDPRETSKVDEEREELAREYAKLGDAFVSDGFGVVHRKQASVYDVAKLLPSAAGLLVVKEIESLGRAVNDPERPYTVVLGGSKVSDKLGVISNLLGKADRLLIGGGMAYTFLAAQGYEVGTSLLEKDQIDTVKGYLETAKANGVELLLPVDTVVAPTFAADAPATVVPADALPADQMGLDIGPETRQLFADAIATSKTVVWNGPMGVFEFPAFAEGTKAVAKAISESDAFSVIGGGDSAAAVRTLGFDEATFSHISTGGGASLELLEGKTLPGIAVLND